MDLALVLKSKNENLASSVERIREFCEEKWKTPLLPWFTDHGVKHSDRVINIIGKILAVEKEDFLTNDEIFILLAAAYLHDIGMQYLKIDNISIDCLSKREYDYIRNIHPQKSYEQIMDINQPTMLDDEYKSIVALVAKGHGTDFFSEVIDEFTTNKEIYKPNNNKVRANILTALLLIGDELDLQSSRVVRNFIDMQDYNPSSYSLVHWYKHHYVAGVEIDNKVIKISMRFPPDGDSYKDLFKELIETKLIKEMKRVISVFKNEGLLLIQDLPDIKTHIENHKSRQSLPEDVLFELKKMLEKNNPKNLSNILNTQPIIVRTDLNDSFIVISDSLVNQVSTELTISLRVLFHDVEPQVVGKDWQSIIQKRHYNDSYGLMLCTDIAPSNNKILSFYLNGCKKTHKLQPGELENRVDYIWSDLQAGKWYSIVCTYNGSEASIYVDGVKCKSVYIEGEINKNDQNIFIGRDSKSYYTFNGEIEDLIIIDRFVTDEEITMLHILS